MLFHIVFTVKLRLDLALDRYCSLFSGDHEFAESIVAVTHGVTKRGHVNKASRCCRRCVKFDRFLAVIFEATAAPFCLPLRPPPPHRTAWSWRRGKDYTLNICALTSSHVLLVASMDSARSGVSDFVFITIDTSGRRDAACACVGCFSGGGWGALLIQSF